MVMSRATPGKTQTLGNARGRVQERLFPQSVRACSQISHYSLERYPNYQKTSPSLQFKPTD